MGPPELSTTFEQLPLDPTARHEALVDVFGECLFSARDSVLQSTRSLAESSQARDRLGEVFRAPFQRIGELDSSDREAAYEFAGICVGTFAREILVLLANRGIDVRFGANHAVRFRLDIEICSSDTGEIIETQTINTGGKKFLADYWGRWLNRFRTIRRNAE